MDAVLGLIQTIRELHSDIGSAVALLQSCDILTSADRLVYTTKLDEIAYRIDNMRVMDISVKVVDDERLSFHDCIADAVNKLMDAGTCVKPKEIVDEYINRLTNRFYGYQGGRGHRIFGLSFPTVLHHWVIRPAYYEICKPTLIESLCMLTDIRRPVLSPVATVEIWGN